MASEYRIEVRVRYPDEAPVVNLEITALPFDRDALRDSLATASEVPRPKFADLESELASYALPDLSGLEEALSPWQAIYDSVRLLSDSLNSHGPDGSTQYANAYARLRAQYQRLAQNTVQRDAAMREQIGDDRDLAMRVAAAADSLRAWERTALAAYPELADSVMARDGRTLRRATTDANGITEFTLAPGRWWFVARYIDPENPFREYYWNVGVRVRWIGSKSVPLFDGNGVSGWRY
jgi:hypothetical protein